jgi:hypothetical protein
MLVSCSAYSTLKMEATCCSETSVDFQRTTRRYIPEDSTLQDKKFDQKWQWTCMQAQQFNSVRTSYVKLHMKLTKSMMLCHFMVLRNILAPLSFMRYPMEHDY